MKNLVALAVATTALMTCSAQAALQKQGFEVGARAGYAWQQGDLNMNQTVAAPTVPLVVSKDLHENGTMAGVFVGYNWICNQLLLGLDVSADWLHKGDRHDFLAAPAGGANVLNSVRFERDFIYGLSGRVGFRSWDLGLGTPFVRLGVERANNKLDYRITTVPGGVATLDGSDTTHETGYLVGLGFDIPVLKNNTNLRLEYQYHWQNRAEFDLRNPAGTFVAQADLKPKAHFLTLGFAWGQL